VRGGYFIIDRQSANIGHVKVTILDSAFDDADLDATDFHSSTASLTHYDYNAFLSGADRTSPQGANDVIVSDFDWQSSWLGRFYLPVGSDLIDEGGVTAPNIGLYHFTTQTANDSKETTSTVDMGYHYVGVDEDGMPIDTDGDGTPDYKEDVNGNGDVDSGETDWEDAEDLGFRVFITRPKNNSIIP
jgi:hypothetical protein